VGGVAAAVRCRHRRVYHVARVYRVSPPSQPGAPPPVASCRRMPTPGQVVRCANFGFRQPSSFVGEDRGAGPTELASSPAATQCRMHMQASSSRSVSRPGVETGSVAQHDAGPSDPNPLPPPGLLLPFGVVHRDGGVLVCGRVRRQGARVAAPGQGSGRGLHWIAHPRVDRHELDGMALQHGRTLFLRRTFPVTGGVVR